MRVEDLAGQELDEWTGIALGWQHEKAPGIREHWWSGNDWHEIQRWPDDKKREIVAAVLGSEFEPEKQQERVQLARKIWRQLSEIDAIAAELEKIKSKSAGNK